MHIGGYNSVTHTPRPQTTSMTTWWFSLWEFEVYGREETVRLPRQKRRTRPAASLTPIGLSLEDGQ